MGKPTLRVKIVSKCDTENDDVFVLLSLHYYINYFETCTFYAERFAALINGLIREKPDGGGKRDFPSKMYVM